MSFCHQEEFSISIDDITNLLYSLHSISQDSEVLDTEEVELEESNPVFTNRLHFVLGHIFTGLWVGLDGTN
jgi:hypothetical protein